MPCDIGDRDEMDLNGNIEPIIYTGAILNIFNDGELSYVI